VKVSRLTISDDARVLGPDDGELLGADGMFDRFMIGPGESGGRFALVEHRIPAKALAAPLHRHSREDEFSFVLVGRLGARLGERDLEAGPGELVFKPRDEWHTFWNAGEAPLRMLELISPAGFEQLFRDLDAEGGELSPEVIEPLAHRYGLAVDFEGTMPIAERPGLSFLSLRTTAPRLLRTAGGRGIEGPGHDGFGRSWLRPR
jgi:mannose-6-phosphate isomerase-like protein (cupin superfamily)